VNEAHVQQIFDNYREKFDKINNEENQEYKKWQIVQTFRKKMDQALDAPAGEFPERLQELKELSGNLIDKYTCPFEGLVNCAKRDPETVQKMFRQLYEDDKGNLRERQRRIQDFLGQCRQLRENHELHHYGYKNDIHSVTGYLFLYDPDHNYIFKGSEGLDLAECMEFEEDWGSGDNVKLSVYYRMCDQLVEEIRKEEDLLAIDASRFSRFGGEGEPMHPDSRKHILAMDLILGSGKYGLLENIDRQQVKSKERKQFQENRFRALEYLREWKQAVEKEKRLQDAEAWLGSVYAAGTPVRHKKYGDGVIKEAAGHTILVEFSGGGEKKLNVLLAVTKGLLSQEGEAYLEQIQTHGEYLKKESFIRAERICAERNLEPYGEYL
jgi:hypothetical protein